MESMVSVDHLQDVNYQVVLDIDERPIAIQSVRQSKSGHSYQPARVKKFKRDVGRKAQLILGKHWQLIEGEVWVDIDLNFKLPKSARKAQRDHVYKLGHKLPYLSRPDVDNCTKGILDALNGIAWTDDSLVRDLHVRKNYAAEDSIRITLMRRQ
jgi:Holliday junction resolvase RusA-like endonuclease